MSSLNGLKSVILASRSCASIIPAVDLCHKHLLPVANEPLIVYLLDALRKKGVEEAAIVHSGFSECELRRLKAASRGYSVRFIEDKGPTGTAGSLKAARDFIGGSDLLVINSGTYPQDFDLAAFFDFHSRNGSSLTAAVEREEGGVEDLEGVEVGEGSELRTFHSLHRSREKRSRVRASGIYLMSPSVLEHIPDGKYWDIKEQLIPSLKREGVKVLAFNSPAPVDKVNTVSDYIRLNRQVLSNVKGLHPAQEKFREIKRDVWAGSNVKVSPRSFIIGPAVLGDGCVIGDYANVIGPASIGAGSVIEDGAFVRESIVWEGARIGENSRVEYSLVCANSSVEKYREASHALILDGDSGGALKAEVYGISAVLGDRGSLAPVIARAVAARAYFFAKRAFDIALSSVLLLLLLPAFAIIAAAIKADSRGPVIFRQLRCGIGGKDFHMYKFRTMVDNAEAIQCALVEKNQVDGPMFKMFRDPRITRVGSFLRKTSLDEMPQIINVLRGEMSFVGPRPLKMEEMAFCPSWRDCRLSVKPGITGLWQIHSRDAFNFSSWINFDMAYVRNQSFWLDLKILFKTLAVVFRGA